MAKSKYMWHRLNEEMKRKGLAHVTWKEFISDKPVETKRPRKELSAHTKKRKSFYNFEPEQEPEKVIVRPPAVYDNKSVYEKYGE